MEENKNIKVAAISGTEEDLLHGARTENVVILKDFPRITHRQYVINRTEQQNAIWNDLLGNRGMLLCNQSSDRRLTIESGLFWISCLFQFIGLVLSYSKDTMVDLAIFRTTILEIFFALAGILLACYKQWHSWSYKTDLQDSEAYLRSIEDRIKVKSIHISGFILASNLAGCIMLLCGFTLLLFFDREHFAFLKSMVYFTGLTIFALAVVDKIIMNKLTEGRAIMEQDQLKLLLHEIKEELFETLQIENKYERVKILRDYIQRFKLFKLQPRSCIYPI